MASNPGVQKERERLAAVINSMNPPTARVEDALDKRGRIVIKGWDREKVFSMKCVVESNFRARIHFEYASPGEISVPAAFARAGFNS